MFDIVNTALEAARVPIPTQACPACTKTITQVQRIMRNELHACPECIALLCFDPNTGMWLAYPVEEFSLLSLEDRRGINISLNIVRYFKVQDELARLHSFIQKQVEEIRETCSHEFYKPKKNYPTICKKCAFMK